MALLPKPPKELIIYEDKDVYVCVADYPITRGHCVVVWKHSVADLSKLSQKDYEHLMLIVDQARNDLMAVLNVEKVYLLYMDELNHVHWHLVPRYDAKGLNIFLHKPHKRRDLELAHTLRERWGKELLPRALNVSKSRGTKRGLYYKAVLVFLLLLLPLVAFSQYKADHLLNQATQLDKNKQFSEAAKLLDGAEKYISLPSTGAALQAESSRNNRWRNDKTNIDEADSFVSQSRYREAIYLFEAVSADYPDYASAQSKIKDATKYVPATENSFSNPVLVAANNYCRVDATKAPDLIGTAINLASTCQSEFPKIENLLHNSNYPPPHRVYLQNINNSYEDSGNIYLSINHFRQFPNDAGELVHELTHVVQGYPSGPTWVKEGMADYVRFELGYISSAYGYGCNQSTDYNSGYNCSATFLNFVAAKYGQSVIKEIDSKTRGGSYSDNIFLYKTGQTIGQLYKMCLSSDCKGGHK
jgi:diadenosine tetraphosphate (Ap4A) HIT family hydrolase